MPFTHAPATRARALGLVRSGLVPRVAAEQVGVDPSTVYAWLHAEAPDLVRRPPAAGCFRCSPDQLLAAGAYAHLLGPYLGDGWSGRGRGSSWSLSVACDDACPGLATEAADSMRAVLATSTCAVRRKGCHEIKSWSSHWPCLLPQHGPGKKHQRPIVLEPWQREAVTEHAGRFLRGLFHSHGWRGADVVVHRVGERVERRHSTRYEFMNLSHDIRLLCTQALDELAIACRPNGPYRVSVARRAAVATLDEHVGPRA